MKYLALSVPGYTDIHTPGGLPSGNTSIQALISVFIDLFLVIVILVSFFYLIYGGFKWMASVGNEEHLATAKQAIIYSILGLVVSFLSFLIIRVLGQFIGINLLQLPF